MRRKPSHTGTSICRAIYSAAGTGSIRHCAERTEYRYQQLLRYHDIRLMKSLLKVRRGSNVTDETASMCSYCFEVVSDASESYLRFNASLTSILQTIQYIHQTVRNLPADRILTAVPVLSRSVREVSRLPYIFLLALFL